MDAGTFFDALEAVGDKYITEAGGGYETGVRSHTFRRFPRKALIAAAVAVLLCSFMTALAVDTDFRNTVFTLFHISTPDAVLPVEDEPPQASPVENIYQGSIADAVTIDYIRIDGNLVSVACGNGVLCLYPDTNPSDAAFYSIEDGQLVPLSVNTVDFLYRWNGTSYPVQFIWCEHDNTVCVYTQSDKLPANDTAWSVTPISGRTDAVILTLSQGRQEEYSEAAVLLDLDTMAVSDPFEGCGVSDLNGISEIEFSTDMTKAILTGRDTIYLCDITAKTLHPISELSGTAVDSARFIDCDTVLCGSVNDAGTYTWWSVSLESMERTVLFSNTPLFRQETGGVLFTTGRYCLYIDAGRQVYVTDLKTGSRSLVENFTWPQDGSAAVTGSGSKLLFTQFDQSQTGGGLSISQLGVIDAPNHTFTLLDREGYASRWESVVFWFDNDTPAIWAGAGQYRYLYLYTIQSKGAAYEE